MVRDAFLKVDRAHYSPHQAYAYEDSPQSIGHGATISAPHMHASATESLMPYLTGEKAGKKRDIRVLDVGSGSGYLTSVFAEVLSATGGRGEVIGVEHIQALRDLGEKNFCKTPRGMEAIQDGRVKFVVGDGRLGWPSQAGEEEGFDAIHVGAGARKIHVELVQQLRSPGRMFIPVDDPDGRGDQHIWIVDKDENGKVSMEKTYGVRYVPLTDAPES